MPSITPGTPLHSFLDAICKAASEVFSQALGAKWSVEIDSREIDSTDPAAPIGTSVAAFQISTSGGLQGPASIQVGIPDALLMAQKFLQEPPDPSAELNKDRKDALEELLRQVAGLAATKIKSLFGETKLEVSTVEPPTWQGVDVPLVASEAASEKRSLELRLSPELLASVSSTSVSSTKSAPGTDLAANSEATSAAVTHEPNFDLLLGVNLNLTLRFGQRVLPLREILDLTSGSVIELDREVEEPADLLLGDKLIARGEVVIVDGNYGIRITEVADARQRIGTL
jgi:flagellar motor switch protein FliN